MTTRNPFLVNWLKSAYSMEMGLVPLLEEQTRQPKTDPGLRQGLEKHLQQTRQHVDLLKGCLQRMGENVSAIRPSNPITAAYGLPNSGTPDRTRQTELIDYVTEAFEVASYRALRSLAETLGDEETSRICDQILQDELAITQALDQRVPGLDGNMSSAMDTWTTGASDAVQENIRVARANFDALNAHDLNRSEQSYAPDYRSEATGVMGEMDRQQDRAFVQAYITAFPDLHFEIQSVTSSEDNAVVEWVATGTHDGPLVGAGGRTLPPTGRKARGPGFTSFQFRNGKIIRSRVCFDTSLLMQQLGVLGNPTSRGIVHIEIPASDRDATARFYKEMFDWEYEHMPEEMRYTTFRTGTVGGGFPDLGDMYEPDDVVLYIESNDIDADLGRAGRLGATTAIPKTEIPGMGWFAFFRDPTGNRIGLFQNNAG